MQIHGHLDFIKPPKTPGEKTSEESEGSEDK
jgi:hypothetical protein